MKIGVNTMGIRGKLYHDFDGTIYRLKEAGITSLEVCVEFAESTTPPEEVLKHLPKKALDEMKGGVWSCAEAPAKIQKVRDMGLDVVSVHMMLGFNMEAEVLVKAADKIIPFAAETGIKNYVISLMVNKEGLAKYINELKTLSDKLNAAGLNLLYHNHEAEVENNAEVLAEIAEVCPNIKMEIDVGWSTYAKYPAVELMKRFGDRLILLHLKDVSPDACPENRHECFTAVGDGAVPLEDVLRASANYPIIENGIIIDQDESKGDILDDVATGVNNVKRCFLT